MSKTVVFEHLVDDFHDEPLGAELVADCEYQQGGADVYSQAQADVGHGKEPYRRHS